MIAILTGPIRTGKTTALAHTFAEGGRGILQPVINGRRHVVDVAAGEARCLDATAETPQGQLVRVGRFTFDGGAFEWSITRVHYALHAASADEWVIIDEVGPLELAGHGLASVVHQGVQYARRGGRVLVVVRDGLVEAVCRAFAITAPRIVRLGEPLPDGRVVEGR
ncbi:MAG: hypothetical protein RhofKO_41150 [Rhodothermales bacterium]